MKKLFFSGLALGTLAATVIIQPTAATATEAVSLTENEMDRISAGHGGSLSVRDMLAGEACALVRNLLSAGDTSALGRNLRATLKRLDTKLEDMVDRLVAGAEPMRLVEADMDGITAGASLSLATGASVTGSYATAHSVQEESGGSLPGGGAVITGHGVAVGSASGRSTSGTPIAEARASGDKKDTGTFKKVVNVPGRTVVIAATWGYAIDLPAVARK